MTRGFLRRRAAPPRLLPETVDILRRLDTKAATGRLPAHIRPYGGPKPNGAYADAEEIKLAGMHKLRVLYRRVFTRAEVELSRNWLTQNGWHLGFGDDDKPTPF